MTVTAAVTAAAAKARGVGQVVGTKAKTGVEAAAVTAAAAKVRGVGLVVGTKAKTGVEAAAVTRGKRATVRSLARLNMS